MTRDPQQQRVGTTVVFLSSVKWNAAWQRHQSLARAAAATTTVVFVEPHPRGLSQAARAAFRTIALASRRALRFSPTDTHAGAGTPRQPQIHGVTVLRWTLPDLLPGHTLKRIRAAMLPSSEPIVIQYVPSRTQRRLADRLRPAAHMYDKVLDWNDVPTAWCPPRNWRRHERDLEGVARLVTDSIVMHRAWLAAGRASLLVQPAADDEFVTYRWQSPPAEGPIGYFGTVQHDVVDVGLMCEVSRAHPLEIVGFVDHESRQQLTRAGAVVLDPVNVNELPPIINEWSAILLPYQVGDRQQTLVPAKIWNAIASGRPVVTSGLRLPAEIASHTLEYQPGARSTSVAREQLVPNVPSWHDAWNRISEFARSA